MYSVLGLQHIYLAVFLDHANTDIDPIAVVIEVVLLIVLIFDLFGSEKAGKFWFRFIHNWDILGNFLAVEGLKLLSFDISLTLELLHLERNRLRNGLCYCTFQRLGSEDVLLTLFQTPLYFLWRGYTGTCFLMFLFPFYRTLFQAYMVINDGLRFIFRNNRGVQIIHRGMVNFFHSLAKDINFLIQMLYISIFFNQSNSAVNFLNNLLNDFLGCRNGRCKRIPIHEQMGRFRRGTWFYDSTISFGSNDLLEISARYILSASFHDKFLKGNYSMRL